MKSRLLVIIFILAALPYYSDAQKIQKGKAKQTKNGTSKPSSLAVNLNFYKHYVGTSASGAKAVLDLHRLDSLIYGNYYDNSIDTYVYLTGKVDKNQIFKLSVTDGRSLVAKKKELKNFSISGKFILPDSISAEVSKNGVDRTSIWLRTNKIGSLTFELYYKGNKVSTKNKALESKYLFSMSSLYPNEIIQPITDSLISDAKKLYFPKKYKQIQVARLQMLEAIQTEELASWKRSNQAFATGKSKTPSNIERTERADVFFNSSDLLCLAYNSYLDNGGMHPNSAEVYRNYDIAGKIVLHLNNVFQTAALPKLPSLIASAFLKQYNVVNAKSYTKLSDVGLPDELPLPVNFAFNQKGVFFIYNEGELGLSYTSKVSVFIEYTDLKQFIDPKGSFAKLL